MKRKDFLETSVGVTTERTLIHGKPEDVFAKIAAYWSKYLGREITPVEVSTMMMLFKIARFQENPANIDNLIDVAGYAACTAELLDKEEDCTPAVTR